MPGIAGGRKAKACAPGSCDSWPERPQYSLDPPRLVFTGVFPAGCGERWRNFSMLDRNRYALALFTQTWRALGGVFNGAVREGSVPMAAVLLTQFESPPLSEVIRDINKFSNNVMAQQLFLSLAYALRGRGTPEAARQVVSEWLASRFGEDAAGTVVDNGSGLSRQSRTSAGLLARLLQHAFAHPTMPELMGSLPVTGVDGTLLRTKTHLGRAHLKSGSLRDVTGLAGYVLSNSGRRYVLVVVVNHPAAGAARPALEALVQWAAEDGRPAVRNTP